jgi:PAS domain S-box-containing protein
VATLKQNSIDVVSKYVIYSRTDLKGIITEVSEAFCIISQFTKEELLGKPHNFIRHEDMPSEVFEEMWRTIQSHNTWTGEVKNRRKDNSFYWVSATVVPEYTEKGDLEGYISVRQDITAKKELEALSDNQEKRIQDIVNKSKQKDQQLFQQARLVSMGEMIENISHQWRQPLSYISTISSSIQLSYELGQKPTEEHIITSMDNITEKTNYLSNTIETFRDFINEDKKVKNVLLHKRIERAINIISGTLNYHHIELKNEIDYTSQLKVKLPLGELSQVLINIINNAKDVLVERKIQKPWIKIATTSKNDRSIISIEDNAGGIPDDILPQIFNPYFTTKHASQGTGLGLHMSYKIVHESLNGKLYCKNGENGAIFFIEIPLTYE